MKKAKIVIIGIFFILIVAMGWFWFFGDSFFRDAQVWGKTGIFFSQSPAKKETKVIGILNMGGVYDELVKGAMEQLSGEGYAEDDMVEYVIRDIEGDEDRIQQQLDELVSVNGLDVLYATSAAVTIEAAKTCKDKMPVVFNGVDDPIAWGVVTDFSSPSKDVTGCSDLSLVMTGKRLELFKTAFPQLHTVWALYDKTSRSSLLAMEKLKVAAQKLNLQVREIPVTNREGLNISLSNLNGEENLGMFVLPDNLIVSNIELITQKAQQLRVPIMGHEASLAKKGVTMTYGANYYELGKQCADNIAGILRGKSPDKIPVQTPNEFELVINKTKSDELGVTITPEILIKTDRFVY